ncbi:MAG TPA: glycosyltransferase [Desulfobacterales bacterium]|nr:glycosyltransferase [Desulfobacterales bacterium]
MQADLHVHSRHSTRPSQWFLQKIGCPESFTEPLHLYHIARRRGMTLVTITDHNKIDGALEIAHLPGAFVSEEVTSYFPEDGCKVHVLAYHITEAQHTDIQKLRASVYDLVGYLQQARITCAVAHPFYAVNDKLTPEHFEKLLLLFRIFELNGDSDPGSNRCLADVLGRLTPADLERLADKHGLAPIWPEPWIKNFVGGSDDHSSLSISRNYTRVPGAVSAADFLDGVAAGRAEIVERPSSPQTLAHNLYSIAYQFYRHKLDLGQQVPQEFLLRYVDRSLRCTGEEDGGLLSRLHFLWQYRRLRKIKGSIPGPLVDLLKRESNRLIAEEPDLFELPREGERISQRLEDRWFQFINKMSSRILQGFANHLIDHFSGANLFSIFHTIGSAGGFCTLLAPYFVGFAHHSAQRRLAHAVMAHLRPADASGMNDTPCAIFADRLEEARDSALFAIDATRRATATIITCEAADGPGVHRFAPIGTYEFGDLPGHRLVYPPVLDMLDYCFRHDVCRLHLASAGPTGLAGLLIARFLKLPVEATYHDAVGRLAQALTRDGFIEDLSWKYLAWFYNQVDVVYVPSRDVQRDLEQKGVAPDRLRLLTRSAPGVRAAGYRPLTLPQAV